MQLKDSKRVILSPYHGKRKLDKHTVEEYNIHSTKEALNGKEHNIEYPYYCY